MKNKKGKSLISYFDLLCLIRDNKTEDLPNHLRLYIARESQTYHKVVDCVGNQFTHYYIDDETMTSQNFEPYMRDSILDVSSFDKIIEIID